MCKSGFYKEQCSAYLPDKRLLAEDDNVGHKYAEGNKARDSNSSQKMLRIQLMLKMKNNTFSIFSQIPKK